MRIRNLGHIGKTGSFAVVHLMIALSIGYLLTDSLILAGLISLVEPALNTIVHAVFDRWWTRRHGEEPAFRKTVLFAMMHFVNAVAVVWALTGSVAIAGALALIEPVANAAALHAFDRWWARGRRKLAASPVPCRRNVQCIRRAVPEGVDRPSLPSGALA